jgi:anti-sigma regulatory factor (Ser/Thr protein kinase)
MSTNAVAVCVTTDPVLRRVIRRTLSAADIKPVFAASCDEALAEAARKPFVIVVDQLAAPTADIEALLGRIDWEAKVLVIGDLQLRTETLALLEHERCDNLLNRTEPVEEDELVVTSVKLLGNDIFGLEKYLTWGTVIRELEVSSYDEKRAAIEELAEFASGIGCRRRIVDRIEMVTDELLMNALYDAPATHHGRKRSEYLNLAVPGGGPVTDRPVSLKYACDGRYMVLSVLDRFGTLRKEKIVEHLRRATQRDGRPLKESEPGAGLGLYLIMNLVSRFVANIEPGKATEVICLMDLRKPSRKLRQFTGSVNIFFARPGSTGQQSH